MGDWNIGDCSGGECGKRIGEEEGGRDPIVVSCFLLRFQIQIQIHGDKTGKTETEHEREDLLFSLLRWPSETVVNL